jgi:hypothetical protein
MLGSIGATPGKNEGQHGGRFKKLSSIHKMILSSG